MADVTIIPLLNAQQISMASLAPNSIIRPDAAGALAREMALALLQQESKQVEKPEPSAKTALVNDENGSSGGSFAGSFQRDQAKESQQEEPEPQAGTNPMVGNLLNVKV